MRNRWRLWLGILLPALLIAGAVIAYALYEADPIRYNNVEQIQVGMTRLEVEELLGCPPGNYMSGPVQFENLMIADGVGGMLCTTFIAGPDDIQVGGSTIWSGDHGMIVILFDGEDKVQHKNRYPGQPVRSKWLRWLDPLLGR